MQNVLLFAIILRLEILACGKSFKTVTYNKLANTTQKTKIACLVSTSHNLFVAARVNDVTKSCEGIDWDLGFSPSYEVGYTYLFKTETVEIFNPPVEVYQLQQWLFPGYFGVGAKLELTLTMPSSSSWKGFTINIVDTTALTFSVYDNDMEVVMVHIMVRRDSNTVILKGLSTPGVWNNLAFLAFPFVDGGTHKITVLPRANVMEVQFDHVTAFSYAHLTGPENARQFLIAPMDASSNVFLHNITFISKK